MATTSERALTLLSLLSTGGVFSASTLAQRLEVAERTVRRDVTTLRDLGYEIEPVKGLGGGYRMRGGTRLPPMVFDEDQVVAIAVALQTAPSVLTGISDSNARALDTVRQVMPERLRVESHAFTVALVRNYWEFPAAPLDSGVVREVGAAVRRRHVLHADYDEGDPPSRIRVEPHQLVVWAARWYLVAYDLDQRRWRVLRLDRIAARAPTHTRFDDRPFTEGTPESLVKRSFDRGDSVFPWPCTGSAVMDVPATVAAEFAPGGSVVERITDTSCRLRMGAWSWSGLAGLLLTFGSTLTQVEPGELRDAFVDVRMRIGSIGPAAGERPVEGR